MNSRLRAQHANIQSREGYHLAIQAPPPHTFLFPPRTLVALSGVNNARGPMSATVR